MATQLRERDRLPDDELLLVPRAAVLRGEVRAVVVDERFAAAAVRFEAGAVFLPGAFLAVDLLAGAVFVVDLLARGLLVRLLAGGCLLRRRLAGRRLPGRRLPGGRLPGRLPGRCLLRRRP